MSEHYNDYLIHYGVKGMKWGVVHEREYEGSGRRRAKNQNGSGLTEKQKRKILAGVGIGVAGVGLALGGRKLMRMKNLKTAKKVLNTKPGVKAKTELKNKVRPLKTKMKNNATGKIEAKGSSLKTKMKNNTTSKMEVKGSSLKAETKVNVSAEEKKILDNYSITKKDPPNLEDMNVLSSEVKKINAGNTGFSSDVNCSRCSFAFELRARGYDVKAPNVAADKNMDELFSLYKNPKVKAADDFYPEPYNYKDIIERLEKNAEDQISTSADIYHVTSSLAREQPELLSNIYFLDDGFEPLENILKNNTEKFSKDLVNRFYELRERAEALSLEQKQILAPTEQAVDHIQINRKFVEYVKSPDVFPPGARGHLVVSQDGLISPSGHSLVMYNKPNEGILVIDTQQDYIVKVEDFFGLNSEGIFTVTPGKTGETGSAKFDFAGFHRTDNLEFDDLEEILEDMLCIPSKEKLNTEDNFDELMRKLKEELMF